MAQYSKLITSRYTYKRIFVLSLYYVIIMSVLVVFAAYTVSSSVQLLIVVVMGAVGAGVICSLLFISFQKNALSKERERLITVLIDQYKWKRLAGWSKLTNFFKLSVQDDTTFAEYAAADFYNVFRGDDWQYGEYKYTTFRAIANIDYEATEVFFSIVELKLSRALPHIFFDSSAHGKKYKWLIDPSQKASLEGDFDKYFTTYFPKHYEIDARSIISPEVMVAMIDAGANDIEIIDDRLILYAPLLPVERLLEFIEHGKNIRSKILDHAMLYRDERLADSNRQSISEFGKRLYDKVSFPWRSLVLLIASITIAMIPTHEFDQLREVCLPISVISGALFGLFWVSWLIAKKKNQQIDSSYEQERKG